MKVLKILLPICGVIYILSLFQNRLDKGHNDTELWNRWKLVHSKNYLSEDEDNYRYSIFLLNKDKVMAHNSKQSTYRLGLNNMADLTEEEFRARYTSTLNHNVDEIGKADTFCPSAIDCPILEETSIQSINWTSKGAVTGIKNQGSCGSCWAFSATGSLEGLNYINSSTLISFSEQQIIDCDPECYGCDGCYTYLALEYTAKFGIEDETTYPYVGFQQYCTFNKSQAKKVNTGYQCIQQKNVSQLKAAAAQQPVAIAVQADVAAWQLYQDGVVANSCGDLLDHAVLLTGYGSVPDYNGTVWFIKNSWGEAWGVQGYIFISQDSTQNQGYGVCGILRCPNIPINTNSEEI